MSLSYAQVDSPQLKINIFSVSNGVGLERDRKILATALKELGHVVQEKEMHKSTPRDEPQAGINIYFESINEECLSTARLNWFVPNPEYYLQDISLLERIDLILCRTQQAERIFQALNKRTYFLGFTSLDRYDEGIEKNFRSFFHLAGASGTKNTSAVVELWRNNRYLPHLTVIRHGVASPFDQHNVRWFSSRLSEEDLRYLQNYHGIHVCPSIAEGYGHYIIEAMSVGAVVITTNAPPMNEFILDKRCLVSYSSVTPHALGTAYIASPFQLAKVVYQLVHLPFDELKKIGDNNRLRYLQKTQEFHENLRKLFELEGLP